MCPTPNCAHHCVGQLADAVESLLATGAALPPAERRAQLYSCAARSRVIHLWLRWVDAFAPAFAIALLLLLAGMLTALAGAVNVTVLLVLAGTTVLATLAIKLWRIGWQVLHVAAALAEGECPPASLGGRGVAAEERVE